MPDPDYKRAFDTEDFRGYFMWDEDLTKAVKRKLYHACHIDELEDILESGQLNLRSEWSLRLPEFGMWKAPGVWTGLNYFNQGNRYGPFLLEFPLSILNGKHFMAFRRIGERRRHFFVQYEARIPIFVYEDEKTAKEKQEEKQLWRNVNAKHYFDKADSGTIWDIVLTHPVSISDVIIQATEHPKCISGKCNGTGRTTNRKTLDGIIEKEFDKLLKKSAEYAAFASKFPNIDGMKITLPELDT